MYYLELKLSACLLIRLQQPHSERCVGGLLGIWWGLSLKELLWHNVVALSCIMLTGRKVGETTQTMFQVINTNKCMTYGHFKDQRNKFWDSFVSTYKKKQVNRNRNQGQENEVIGNLCNLIDCIKL